MYVKKIYLNNKIKKKMKYTKNKKFFEKNQKKTKKNKQIELVKKNNPYFPSCYYK